MAKTFDNISEASATNYLFLFSQRTLALQNEPPTPPPLNALGLPCKGMYLLWEWVQKQQQKASSEQNGDEHKPRASEMAVDGQGKDTKDTFAEKITPLAEKITEYINDHQDDAAQEDRWRTTMKRETMKRFREQHEAISKQHKAIAEVRQAIAEVHQLIKKIANTNQAGAAEYVI